MPDDPTTNEEIYNALVQRQIYIERYKNGVIRQLQPILNKAIADMKSKIADLPNNTTRMQLEAALRQIYQIQDSASRDAYNKLVDELKQLASVEGAFTVASIAGAIPQALQIVIGAPTSAFLARMVETQPFQGLTANEWMDRISATATIRARQQLFIGLAEGESIPDLVTRMASVGDQITNDLSMVVRTAVNAVTNEARDAVYSENTDVIKEIMWRSTLDSRTSEICQARDGMTWDINENYPTPPAHPNCRSVMVPIIKSLAELGYEGADVPEGTRASMDGQVPASETYQTWLGKQSDELQSEILGPTRAEAFRSGGVTLDKFVSDQGKVLTLDQLREQGTI